jgi:hypothetical protein
MSEIFDPTQVGESSEPVGRVMHLSSPYHNRGLCFDDFVVHPPVSCIIDDRRGFKSQALRQSSKTLHNPYGIEVTHPLRSSCRRVKVVICSYRLRALLANLSDVIVHVYRVAGIDFSPLCSKQGVGSPYRKGGIVVYRGALFSQTGW